MATPSRLDTLPNELFEHILSYLIHPRSRLPGLTEQQSTHDFPKMERAKAKEAYYLNYVATPDTDRFAEDLFTIADIQHPFNALVLASNGLRGAVEHYCAHLVKAHNRFNLPIAQLQERGGRGAELIYPDMSRIIYRRLWLQTAPRYCVYCGVTISVYPHNPRVRLITGCGDCFLIQALLVDEVERQFHFDQSVLEANNIRGKVYFAEDWVLRSDVEALALRVYQSKKYHRADGSGEEHCGVCMQLGTLDRHLEIEYATRKKRTLPLRTPRRRKLASPSGSHPAAATTTGFYRRVRPYASPEAQIST